jgi:hypothetical protein
MVVPRPNTPPEVALQETVGVLTLSVAVGRVKVTTAPLLLVALTVISGQVRSGAAPIIQTRHNITQQQPYSEQIGIDEHIHHTTANTIHA